MNEIIKRMIYITFVIVLISIAIFFLTKPKTEVIATGPTITISSEGIIIEERNNTKDKEFSPYASTSDTPKGIIQNGKTERDKSCKKSVDANSKGRRNHEKTRTESNDRAT